MGVFDETYSIAGSVFSKLSFLSILDIIIVAALLYWLYLLIKETRAVQILYGIALLFLIWIFGRILNLHALNLILRYALTAIVVAIPIVFQPELRSALEKIGRTKIVSDFSKLRKNQLLDVIATISQASHILSKEKIGALIVLSREQKLKEHVERGTLLDARLSTELILNIFSPKAALHDGAVVISGNKIKAAGVVLPLSDNKFDYRLGTRHRAAIGISSVSDAIVIIISEERGEISLAIDGILEAGFDEKSLFNRLAQLLNLK